MTHGQALAAKAEHATPLGIMEPMRMRRMIVRVSITMSANAQHRRGALVVSAEVAGGRVAPVCGVAGAPRIAVR